MTTADPLDLIEAALAQTVHRDMFTAHEVADLLLDIQQAFDRL